MSDPRVFEHRCLTRAELAAKSLPPPRLTASSLAAPNSCHGLDVVQAAGRHPDQRSHFREVTFIAARWAIPVQTSTARKARLCHHPDLRHKSSLRNGERMVQDPERASPGRGSLPSARWWHAQQLLSTAQLEPTHLDIASFKNPAPQTASGETPRTGILMRYWPATSLGFEAARAFVQSLPDSHSAEQPLHVSPKATTSPQ